MKKNLSTKPANWQVHSVLKIATSIFAVYWVLED